MLRFFKKKEIPEFRLVPNERGSYNLERIDPNGFFGYLHQCIVNNEDEAKIAIANLKRDIIEL